MTGARVRGISLSHLGTLLIGVVIGIVLAKFGDVFVRFPVESALVAVLVCSVVVLGWACREMLGDLVRRGRRGGRSRGRTEANLDWAEPPRLVLHRTSDPRPNGVRR
ncbi:hypothetical protein [Amycolatopsis sp. FDAARGOS 1241]|uniref:hypothetical protein n=1 Tax=Amycolatopsis sp. FDAARGOS 1241 TaxID=2778070 RepID=UPI0019523A27|nr:hypothetical protein [Amycolatopsis sp. FDAARGOS 1241]QRP47539.1 hypothetical protein I6J71_06175 [Amycolatopsis sp. FDAARGOS 1241]